MISEGALEKSGSGSESGEITTEGVSAEATTESNSIANQSDETNDEELGLEQTESVSQETTTESKFDAKRQTTVSASTETDTKGRGGHYNKMAMTKSILFFLPVVKCV